MTTNAKITLNADELQSIIAKAVNDALAQAGKVAKVAPVSNVKPSDKNWDMTISKDVLSIKVDLTQGREKSSEKSNRFGEANKYISLISHCYMYVDENNQPVIVSKENPTPKDRQEFSVNMCIMEVTKKA